MGEQLAHGSTGRSGEVSTATLKAAGSGRNGFYHRWARVPDSFQFCGTKQATASLQRLEVKGHSNGKTDAVRPCSPSRTAAIRHCTQGRRIPRIGGVVRSAGSFRHEIDTFCNYFFLSA